MLVTLSDKELSRINVIQSVVEKRMRRRDAAHQLALTERQTQHLMNRFRESGAAGLSNLRRGRPGNHRLPESLKLRVLSLLHDHYSDFGPTLAAEKLRERHNITVSVETLRKWMIADGLWVPYSRRRPRVHQPRYRRDCLGELVQIDGSPHDWFEGRAPKCCLLVFIEVDRDKPVSRQARRCDRTVASHINSTASRFWSVVSTFAPEPPEVPPYPAWLRQAAS
ncbi:hypothetical protein SB6409_05514 [Klebsiella pasteurii]|uniref:Sea24 n=1 Tax=Klebsiella pasteurii TaxID=2587529 RepID=A0A9Q9SDV6_9ENTR|nr:hypothetical protein SB6410_04384 [Klebsiella pasteurii]VUT00620.1 hypothetical protein SB6409_05514 [Klebsiella pasteurii]